MSVNGRLRIKSVSEPQTVSQPSWYCQYSQRQGCATNLWVRYQGHVRHFQKFSERSRRIQQRKAIMLFALRVLPIVYTAWLLKIPASWVRPSYWHLFQCAIVCAQRYPSETDELTSLIQDLKALIIGPIRQEILSGYSNLGEFRRPGEKRSCFDNTPMERSLTSNSTEWKINNGHVDDNVGPAIRVNRSGIFRLWKEAENGGSPI